MRRDGDRRGGEGNSISPLSEERGSLSSSSSRLSTQALFFSVPSHFSVSVSSEQSAGEEGSKDRKASVRSFYINLIPRAHSVISPSVPRNCD